MKRVAVIGGLVALALIGCGGGYEYPPKGERSYEMVDGEATLFPLYAGHIEAHRLGWKGREAMAEILGGEVSGGSIYVPPREFIASCRAGLIPEDACP